MPDDMIGGGLLDGCFEGGEGLLAEDRGHAVSEGGKIGRGILGDRVEQVGAEVGEGGLLL